MYSNKVFVAGGTITSLRGLNWIEDHYVCVIALRNFVWVTSACMVKGINGADFLLGFVVTPFIDTGIYPAKWGRLSMWLILILML